MCGWSIGLVRPGTDGPCPLGVRASEAATLEDGQRSDLVKGLPIGRASELLNVSERSAHRAREVINNDVPELTQAVEQGRVSVSAAADVASLGRLGCFNVQLRELRPPGINPR
jgi:hypothetical protein